MRVFSVPVSVPFLRTVIAALVDGRLVEGFGARRDPLNLARATLYLPTRRAGRLAREIFLDELKTDAAILPRIVALGDIDEDELAFSASSEQFSGVAPLDIPPRLGELERRLTLAHLVAAWAKSPVSAPLVVGGPASTLALAGDLARLMDDMVTRGVAWETLDKLVPDQFDKYWQHSLEFLRIARKVWPEHLKEIGRIEPAERRDRLIEAEAARLTAHHEGPVIAAGSTGSMPATAKFLSVVAGLKQGAVVLPGLDTDLDEEAWQTIGGVRDTQGKFTTQPSSNHPQFAMHALLDRFGIKRNDVEILGMPSLQGREVLVSETMRPSSATEQWHDRLAQPDVSRRIAGGMAKLAVVEAPNSEMEALAIAVAMREARHLGRSAALVTPDRALARRVMAALTRWNLEFDDSGGDALMDTPSGIFARLAAEAASKGLEPPTLLALLKHPLFRLGRASGAFRHAIEILELALLRGTRPQAGTAGLARDFDRFRAELRKLGSDETSSLHASEPRAKLKDDQLDQAQALIAGLQKALAPLEIMGSSKPFDFAELAHRHREVLIALSSDQDGIAVAFEEAQGSALSAAFDDLLAEQKPSGLMVQLGDYPDVFQTAYADRMVRRAESASAQLHIYGQLEARLTESDRVILGGLVEGVWPPAPRVDPWLSRPMRHELGLDLPERRIGLSAHDFAQLLGTDDVILTHSAKVGGAPAVASRFLHRLEAVAGEARWDEAKSAGENYVRFAAELDQPDEVVPIEQPAPKPPVATRPLKMSVTAIEDWLRDPYTIYAKHILRLDPLDPVDMPLSAADRGSAIHGALGEFTQKFADGLPPQPALVLRAIGEKYFAPLMERPEARALWWPRFQRIAAWFADWELARRDSIEKIAAEIKGEIKIPLGNERIFTLSARADRIEQRGDGSFAILDYKTGQPPTGKQVRMGLSPQLTLEAAILREGGFENIHAGSSVGELVYVRLSGNNPPGEQRSLELKIRNNDTPQPPDEAADYAREQLEALIRKFENEETAYTSLNLSMWSNRYGAYDDLARIKEWSAAGGLGIEGMVKAARTIPDAVRATQARASDPAASAFVSANAGSGKTHVLVQRVIRLLLDGVAPEKILCITFTKAAAANMAERVFTTLGHWVTLDDDALDGAIRDAGIPHPSARLRKSARKLFACALETPGGLKVQTIHALCTRLLQQFPFEANVPARFAVLDDRDQNEMMERANLGVFLEASRNPDSATGRALMTAMANAADVTFKDVVREACLSRDHFMAWTDAAGSAQAAAVQISAALGVEPDDRIEDVEREILDGPNLPRSRWQEIALALETGSKTDQDQAARLRGALVFTGAAQVDEYLGVFLTEADRTPRKSVATKKFCDNNPAIGRLIESEARRILPLIEKRRAVTARDRTEALLHIATAAAANYRREKQERGLLDYDDLIDKTLEMLDRVSSGWVHYKLDRGVDHVLIDEAQDTSPRQWDIVAHIISEFTSGAGARDGVVRTVFAVGDEKQSIFSFQGAAPREFDLRRRALQRKFEGAGLKFDPVSFTYSFRSGPAILHAVDQVFREQDIFRSIHAIDIGNPIHHALADAGPGQIDLWELAEADDRQDIEGWRAPFDGVSATSPEVKLARRIQAEIKTLVGSGVMTGSKNDRRPLRYGDMLVLVRRRGNAFDAVIQALKHAGIPVAGADRLKLTEHIAIIDLMNLADALLLPQDDLALAVALKSPLFGLGDDDLFKIAWQRKGSLRATLAERAAANGRLRDALWRLEQCERRFASETPFAFYAWLLGGDGGRARILRRLGHEANDALDEFLELALNYERKAPASLQGFMAWLRTADLEVKRDMEISRDEVRVMTVHGAKGLESSVVFLVDTTTSPSDTQRLKLIHLPQGNADPHAPGVVVWAGRKAEDPPAVAAARAAMIGDTEDEYRRLLYVAMTRAADRLIVGGCLPGNMRSVRPLSWYDLITKGLAGSTLQLQEIETAAGRVKRYTRPEEATPSAAPVAALPPPAPMVLPNWLLTPAQPEISPESLLRPSDPADSERHPVRTTESLAQRARALQRGTLAHRLLQSLPDIAAERRREAALAYLARNADGWTEEERQALAESTLALIADGRFAPVFAPGSRAEVSIVGRLEQPGGRTALVSGQIDRLVVTDNEVLIVDFKTNHAPPSRPDEAPRGYVRQLALYRAVLGKLYPQRVVRTALLWTETAELMEISAPALEAELASIISA